MATTQIPLASHCFIEGFSQLCLKLNYSKTRPLKSQLYDYTPLAEPFFSFFFITFLQSLCFLPRQHWQATGRVNSTLPFPHATCVSEYYCIKTWWWRSVRRRVHCAVTVVSDAEQNIIYACRSISSCFRDAPGNFADWWLQMASRGNLFENFECQYPKIPVDVIGKLHTGCSCLPTWARLWWFTPNNTKEMRER